MGNTLKNLCKLWYGYAQTIIILSFFIFVAFYLYSLPQDGLHNNVVVNVIALSALTDGLWLLLHLPRKPVRHKNLSFDARKLTIVIACYNGQDVIAETIKGALVHVSPRQVIVVSDASTDKTAETARQYGVQVFTNKRNLNKAFSISSVMHKVPTRYVLVLDDDTQIGGTFIPTSLLDEGYGAVAFNVLPVKTKTLINAFQLFEYRKSMVMGKSLRGGVGAVGNVSGAIGLYRTADLRKQVTKHSGQYGGEDQQRTAFVHLFSQGKGVTFTDATVETKAPDTLKQFLRQRSLRWNMSLPELFIVNLSVLMNPGSHYLLKIEKAYKIYLLTTDPLRILFSWVIFLHPLKAVILYVFYVCLSFAVWLKTGRKDPFWIIFIFPFYSWLKAGCRFIAHINWFKVKYRYLFKLRHHRIVSQRKLAQEYSSVFVVLVCLWSLSFHYLIKSNQGVLTKMGITKNPSSYAALTPVVSASPSPSPLATQEPAKVVPVAKATEPTPLRITVKKGDGITHIARQAIHDYMTKNDITLKKSQLRQAEDSLRKNMNENQRLREGQIIEVEKNLIKETINDALNQS